MRSTHLAAAVIAIGLIAAFVGTAEARDGCGPGFHRGVHGYCRPNFGYRPYAYGPRFHGYRRIGWHRRWRGFRHAGWHGGLHHRW